MGLAAIDATINSITQLDATQVDRSYRLLGNDDKGIVDFVSIAFRIFGLRIEQVLICISATPAHHACSRRGIFPTASASGSTCLFLGLYFSCCQHSHSILRFIGAGTRALPVLSMVACLTAFLARSRALSRPVLARTSTARTPGGTHYLVEHLRSKTTRGKS